MITEVFHKLPGLLAKNGITVHGIIQVGAGDCEELPIFRQITDKILCIEPNKEYDAILDEQLTGMFESHLNYAIGCKHFAETTLYIPRDRQRSSILAPISEPVETTQHVMVVPLSHITSLNGVWDHNLLVVDVQGAELDVLKSADLTKFDAIVCEMDEKVRYEGAPAPDEITEYLFIHGFTFKEMFRHKPATHIIDGFFVRDREPAQIKEPAEIAVIEELVPA